METAQQCWRPQCYHCQTLHCVLDLAPWCVMPRRFYVRRVQCSCFNMQAKSDNKLLQVRGNAGTHDLQLGRETLAALQSAVSADTEVAVPRYDKSKNEGRGDRAERSSWPHVQGPIDIILFEGWMLGFSPIEETEVAKVTDPLPHL